MQRSSAGGGLWTCQKSIASFKNAGRGHLALLVHPYGATGLPDVVDERTRICPADRKDALEGFAEYCASIGRRDVSASKNECPNIRRLEGKPLQLPVSNSLVSCKYDPSVSTGLFEPNIVSDTPFKLLGMPDNCRTGATQRRCDRGAVERLVQEES